MVHGGEPTLLTLLFMIILMAQPAMAWFRAHILPEVMDI